MDGRTDERKSPCVLQDFVPFGAAAQKAKVSSMLALLSPDEAIIELRRQEGLLRPEIAIPDIKLVLLGSEMVIPIPSLNLLWFKSYSSSM